jgi:hypothetical protein
LCFAAERQGAADVVGFDNDTDMAAVDLLVTILKSRARIVTFNLFDLTPDTFGRFDVVIFAGVLYHLRYPFWALRLVREVMRDGATLLLETAIFVDDNKRAMVYCPVGSESPYEPTSCTFFNRKGLRDTLESMGFVIDHEECLHNVPAQDVAGSAAPPPIDRCVVICRRDDRRSDPNVRTYWEGTAGQAVVAPWDKRR